MIPEGWQQKELGELVTFKSGGTPSKEVAKYWNGDIPWVTAKDMKSFRLNTSLDKITSQGAKNGNAIVPKNTLLILVRGMTLRKDIPVCITSGGMAFNQDVKALIAKDINPDYLGYFLASRKSQLLSLVNQSGHGTGRLQTDLLETFPILIPLPPVQDKIATILEKWDQAIDLIERLITFKQERREWLIHHLLTGKGRIAGFKEPWKKVRIGEVLKEVKRPVKWDDKYLYSLISVRRRSDGIFLRGKLYGYQIKTKKMNLAREGDFLISKMQIVHGASGLVTAEFDGHYISDSYITLRVIDPQIIDIRFFNWMTNLPLMYQSALFSSYGVHIEKMTFNLSDYLKRQIFIPPSIKEQIAIIRILENTDQDIFFSKEQLDAFKTQKKGLMQQLLTGKRRVKA